MLEIEKAQKILQEHVYLKRYPGEERETYIQMFECKKNSKQLAMWLRMPRRMARGMGVRLKLEQYNSNIPGVELIECAKSASLTSKPGSRIKDGQGVCVFVTTEQALLAIIEHLNDRSAASIELVEPVICETENELNEKISELFKHTSIGTPRGVLKPTIKSSQTTRISRDAAVAAWLLKNANGVCECCGKAGPFVSTYTALPYLEVHHVRYLSDGGSDTTSNTIAVCPNCHREFHHGANGNNLRELMYSKISRLVREE